jgi:hypothetical protein
MIEGKPYEGKLQVRFDEGMKETRQEKSTEALLTERDRNGLRLL